MPEPADHLYKALRSHAPETVPLLCALLASRYSIQFDRSTWHPYGFLVTRIPTTQDATIRLHIRPEGIRRRQQPDWPIHNHPWHLISHILYGSVTNTTYRVWEAQANASNRLYRVEYVDPLSVLSATDTGVSVSLVDSSQYTAGDWYDVAAGAYHDTSASADFAATIVLTSQAGTTPPTVVGEWGHQPRYEFVRQICPEAETTAIIGQLLGRIQ